MDVNTETLITSVEIQASVDAPSVNGALYQASLYSINGDTTLATKAILNDTLWGYRVGLTGNLDDYYVYQENKFTDGFAYAMVVYVNYKETMDLSDDCVFTLKTPAGNKEGQLYYADSASMICVFFFDELADGTHEHQIGYDWNIGSTQHWHSCLVPGCEVKIDQEAHTCDSASGLCSVCGVVPVVSVVVEVDKYPVAGEEVFAPKAVCATKSNGTDIEEFDVDRANWFFYEDYCKDGDRYDFYAYCDSGEVFTDGYAYDLYVEFLLPEKHAFAEDCKFTLKAPEGEKTGKMYSFYEREFASVDFFFHELCGNDFNIADVDKESWMYEFVLYVCKYGYMSGKEVVDNTIYFHPNDSFKREEFVQVLYRMEGTPKVEYTDRFSDVADGQWYTNAILWAAENGIVAGINENEYGVGKDITREQLAVMLYSYAKYKGYALNALGSLAAFEDANSIHDWAKTAIKWAVYFEIMSGKGSNMDPLGTATRAEGATMLRGFIWNLAEYY